MRLGRLMLVILPLMMCGCFEVSHQIFVNTDGSGRVVERFTMSKAMIKQLDGIFSSLPSAKGSKSNKMDLYDRGKLKEDAKSYGPGVTYVSSKRVSTKTQEGYEVTYAFKDISVLRINQNPGDKGPVSSGAKSKNKKEENITFAFTKGTPARLTVMFPPKQKAPKDKKKARAKDKAAQQKEMKEVGDILKDLYIGVTIHPEGRIVETDATYNENGTITLLEMDFEKLLGDEKHFRSFVRKEPETIEETKALLKNLPGFKVELNQKIDIVFE